MSRDIGNGDVPVHYMPQLQMCMEILDLEEADFIQYKPAETNWPRPEEFTVVNIKRDREWWEKYFPVMEEFWQKVLHHREHGIEVPEPKVRKPRKKKVIPCEIEVDPEDTYISD